MIPPVGSTGVEMVANEMEGELAMAGIKEGAMWTPVDFRNPCISIDFGTTLDGRITSDVAKDDPNPFAKTIGNFCGLAGAIPDAIVKGTGLVDSKTGTALDVFGDRSMVAEFFTPLKTDRYEDFVDAAIRSSISGLFHPRGGGFGGVPVYADVAKESGVALIGCDAGEKASALDELKTIGSEIHENYSLGLLNEVIDRVCAEMALRLIDIAREEGLVLPNTSIGFTGRAAISGRKPEYILEGITREALRRPKRPPRICG